jgi:hypothetical protein
MTDTTPAATPPTVVQALSAVMADVREVRKDQRNTAPGQGGYAFRGIDAVMNAVGPALRVHGVVVMPRVISCEQSSIEVGQNRTRMGHVRVEVEYTAHGPAGDTLAGTVVAEAMDSGDKATSKAMSVAYRTFLIQALTLPTDDPDPESFTYERSGAGQAQPSQRREPEQAEDRPARPATRPDPISSIRSQIAAFAARNSIDVDKVAARYARRFPGVVLHEETSPTNLNVFYAEYQKDVKIRAETRKWMAANKLTAEEAQARYQTEFEYGSADEINPTNLEAFLKDWQDEVAKQRGGA